MNKRTPSQVGKYSKRKGGNYERDVAKKLSEWWFGDNSILRKTPASGGWSNKYPFDITIEKDFPWGVSGKKVEKWHLEHLIRNEKTIFVEWWHELQESMDRIHKWDSDYVGKVMPALIFSKNHDADYLMLRHSDYHTIVNNVLTSITWVTSSERLYCKKYVTVGLNDFLNKIDADNVRLLCQKK